ncbi:MAG: 16S rRNA (cytosine(967)-C(5))-methyltransferase RsmB, partial [Oscillospiraceae bacterium]|nr:16S rRNA (cytosine(967)-C(5))-methyltransferase RsmB [Oscillospiraceae bacterium]
MVLTAREVALDCLLAGERQGAWSDGYLRNTIRKAGLDSRDAALATQLTYGVLQNKILLDWHLSRLSSTPMDKLEPVVRNVLRLGLYQLGFLDKIPPHAAVNESVSIVKARVRNPKAAALVNAVLRAFERERQGKKVQPDELWVKYSHPEWLVKEFSRMLPDEELEALLEADNTQPSIQAQVDSLRTTVEKLTRELEGEGITVIRHPWLPNCLELDGAGNLERLTAFREGRFYIQDAAAKLSVLAANPAPG